MALLCCCHQSVQLEHEHALITRAQQLPPGSPNSPQVKERRDFFFFYQLHSVIGTRL